MALLTTSISVESIWHKHVFWQMCWYIISTIPYYTFGSFDGKCRAWVPAAFIHPCHGQRVCPHKERQRVEILQKQKKPWRPWSLKRWRWRLQREMGIASQPFRRKKQSGWKSARQQLCNHWRLRCKGAMWRMWQGNHDNCWQHFSVNAKISNMWWVWHSFENVWKRLLQRRIFSSGLRCNVKYFEFSGDSQYPICICFWCVFHHEIFSCWFFTFLLPTVFT